MKGRPEKVYRETCAHCQWQGMPEECADCPTKIAYDYIDERNARIYYTRCGIYMKISGPLTCAGCVWTSRAGEPEARYKKAAGSVADCKRQKKEYPSPS